MRLTPGLRTTSTFGRERYESRYIPANRKRSSTECRKIACVRERAPRIEDPLFSHRVVLFFILSPRREATTRPFIRSLSYMYFCISPVKPPQNIFTNANFTSNVYFISRDSLSLAPFSFLPLYLFLSFSRATLLYPIPTRNRGSPPALTEKLKRGLADKLAQNIVITSDRLILYIPLIIRFAQRCVRTPRRRRCKLPFLSSASWRQHMSSRGTRLCEK